MYNRELKLQAVNDIFIFCSQLHIFSCSQVFFLFSGVQVVIFCCLKVFILRDGASVTEKTIQVAENKNLHTKENKNLYTAENVFIICLQVLFSTSFYFLFPGFNHLVYERFMFSCLSSFFVFCYHRCKLLFSAVLQ